MVCSYSLNRHIIGIARMSTLVMLWLVPISLLYFLADARFMTIASHLLSMSSSKDWFENRTVMPLDRWLHWRCQTSCLAVFVSLIPTYLLSATETRTPLHADQSWFVFTQKHDRRKLHKMWNQDFCIEFWFTSAWTVANSMCVLMLAPTGTAGNTMWNGLDIYCKRLLTPRNHWNLRTTKACL